MDGCTRTILLPGQPQLGVPRPVRRRRPAVQRIRLRARDPVRDVADTAGGAAFTAGIADLRPADDAGAGATAARPAGRVGDRDRVREAGTGSEGDVRVGAHPAPSGLRRVGRRTDRASRQGRADWRAAALLPVTPGHRVQHATEEHGADGGPAPWAGVPAAVPEVQRPDLGVPLAAGRALRATAHGRHGGCPQDRRQCDGCAVLADAGVSAGQHAARHAHDGSRRAGIRCPLS